MKRREFIRIASAGSILSFMPLQGKSVGNIQLKGYLRTNWSEDPFAYGSYSYFANGSNRSDSRALVKPLEDRVFFAGEACHPKYNSTVHAAYESGQLAAKSISAYGHKQIAIIGAGMSGLAAAQACTQAGCAVTVYEARDRIGGRVWTDHSKGMPLELGASWIHGIRGNPLAKLAKEHDLSLTKTKDNHINRGTNGKRLKDRDAPDWLEEVIEIQHLFGAGSDTINERAYWRDPDYGGPDVMFPGGYDSLLSALEGAYSLELNTAVSGITYNTEGVTLHFEHRKDLSYDAVIVTVPLGVLKKENYNSPQSFRKKTKGNRPPGHGNSRQSVFTF